MILMVVMTGVLSYVRPPEVPTMTVEEALRLVHISTAVAAAAASCLDSKKLISRICISISSART